MKQEILVGVRRGWKARRRRILSTAPALAAAAAAVERIQVTQHAPRRDRAASLGMQRVCTSPRQARISSGRRVGRAVSPNGACWFHRVAVVIREASRGVRCFATLRNPLFVTRHDGAARQECNQRGSRFLQACQSHLIPPLALRPRLLGDRIPRRVSCVVAAHLAACESVQSLRCALLRELPPAAPCAG